MPIYTFVDKNTDEVFEIMMSFRDLDAYREAHPHHEKLIDAPNIVSGVSITNKMDDGFKDVLSKISDAHPKSELAEKHGRRSSKQVQTDRAIQKWRSSTSKL
jgi:hypothetical protein